MDPKTKHKPGYNMNSDLCEHTMCMTLSVSKVTCSAQQEMGTVLFLIIWIIACDATNHPDSWGSNSDTSPYTWRPEWDSKIRCCTYTTSKGRKDRKGENSSDADLLALKLMGLYWQKRLIKTSTSNKIEPPNYCSMFLKQVLNEDWAHSSWQAIRGREHLHSGI